MSTSRSTGGATLATGSRRLALLVSAGDTERGEAGAGTDETAGDEVTAMGEFIEGREV
jgi:hypothetical protein